MKSIYIPVDDKDLYRKYTLAEDVVDAIETLITADQQGYLVEVLNILEARGFNGTVDGGIK